MSLETPPEAEPKLNAVAAPPDGDAAIARLREAYLDLEATRPLRELGASSAFINHEIKNYMMVISGYAMLLQRSKTLSDRDRDMVNNIANTATTLQEFNMSVLEASRAGGARGGDEDVGVAALLRSCIDKEFPEQSQRVSIQCAMPQGEALVIGKPQKLSRAFACALSNSFEAGAKRVSVDISVHNYIALITIDDDGKGCGAEEFPKLSETFYTTKPAAAGMGLGLCTMRSIAESHGGHISVYSKNLLGGSNHGLSVQIMIPASKRVSSPASKSEILLVRDGLSDAAAVLSILKRLKIIPRMAGGAKDAAVTESGPALDTVILAAPQQAAELAAKASRGEGKGAVKILTLEEYESGAIFVNGADTEKGKRDLFTEEYIVRYIIGN